MAHTVVAAPPQNKLEIVPRKSFPIVAVVMVGLIVAIATNSLWAIGFYHVVGGGMWTAIDLFLGFILGPILGTMSIPSRVELTKRLMPKMVILMPTLVIMTLAGGFQLARHMGFILSSDKHHVWVVASMIVVGALAIVAIGILVIMTRIATL